MKFFRRTILASALFFSTIAATQTITHFNLVSDAFTCKPHGDLSLVSKYAISLPQSTAKEQQLVANVMKRLEQVGGGATFPYFKKQSIRFVDELTSGTRGCKGGEQLPDGIVLARKVCRYAEAYNAWKRLSNPNFVGLQAGLSLDINETMITHEIGHKVGNTDENYKKFDQAVRPRCMLTNYSFTSSAASRRGEEFAEAFAMFVVKPEFLKSNCPKAYEFFKTVVFRVKGDVPVCPPVSPVLPPVIPKPKPKPAEMTRPTERTKSEEKPIPEINLKYQESDPMSKGTSSENSENKK